jgi:hypothetical protein
MGVARDGQHNKAIIFQTLSLVQASEGAGYNVAGAEIDVTGFNKITVAVGVSRTVTASDDIRFAPLESATTGGAGTAIAADKLLPTYNSGINQKLTPQNAPYSQVFGVINTEEFFKVNFNGVAIDTSDIDLECCIILESEVQPFAGADPNFPSLGE